MLFVPKSSVKKLKRTYVSLPNKSATWYEGLYADVVLCMLQYIAFLVMVCLSVLDSIGMLVYQSYRFSELSTYTDAEWVYAQLDACITFFK